MGVAHYWSRKPKTFRGPRHRWWPRGGSASTQHRGVHGVGASVESEKRRVGGRRDSTFPFKLLWRQLLTIMTELSLPWQQSIQREIEGVPHRSVSITHAQRQACVRPGHVPGDLNPILLAVSCDLVREGGGALIFGNKSFAWTTVSVRWHIMEEKNNKHDNTYYAPWRRGLNQARRQLIELFLLGGTSLSSTNTDNLNLCLWSFPPPKDEANKSQFCIGVLL